MALHYYGQFDPPVDKVLHERYFPNKYDGIAIEAGSYDGIVESSTCFFNKYYNWTTINIEPLNNIYAKLIQNRPDKKSINLNIALSNEHKKEFIVNYKHPDLKYDWGNASIRHTDDHKRYLENISNGEYIKQEVDCITYNELIDNLKLDHVDLFVLDVEGYESNVINGMINNDILPSVFVIEHGHMSTEITSNYLKVLKKKYKLDFISHVNSFYILDE